MLSVFLPFLLILTSAFAQPMSRVKEAALGQEFELKLGQQVLIENERLRISFTNVAEDSRCPEGVQCVWAGNGKVVLRLIKTRKRAATMKLNTGVDPKQNAYQGYEVKLVSLNPYPKKNVRIKMREYVATLVVSRK
jgi:hypothetical protein